MFSIRSYNLEVTKADLIIGQNKGWEYNNFDKTFHQKHFLFNDLVFKIY